jgi:hypothetical protein
MFIDPVDKRESIHCGDLRLTEAPRAEETTDHQVVRMQLDSCSPAPDEVDRRCEGQDCEDHEGGTAFMRCEHGRSDQDDRPDDGRQGSIPRRRLDHFSRCGRYNYFFLRSPISVMTTAAAAGIRVTQTGSAYEASTRTSRYLRQ